MADWLKDVFGDAESMTLEEVRNALPEKVVDLREGGYVSKDKFEAEQRKHKDAQTKAATELSDLQAKLDEATSGDDDLTKRLKDLEEKAQKATEAAESERTARITTERRALVSEKIGNKHFARLALIDAEALVDDDTSFDEALEKVLEANPDYSDEGTGGSEPGVRVKTGNRAGGEPDDDEAEMFKAFADAAGVDMSED